MLTDEFGHLEISVHIPKNFEVEWIKFVLRRVHNMKSWLESRLVKIKKVILHHVIGYPTLDRVNTSHFSERNVIEE